MARSQRLKHLISLFLVGWKSILPWFGVPPFLLSLEVSALGLKLGFSSLLLQFSFYVEEGLEFYPICVEPFLFNCCSTFMAWYLIQYDVIIPPYLQYHGLSQLGT